MTREIPSTSDIAAFWGCPFLIIASRVDYGELGLNGDMGYGGACVTNAFDFRWSLSGHADSTVTLLVKDECRVRGFLNGTAANCNGVKFIIDGVLAGRAWRPYDLTAEFHLTPGRHVLEARAMDGNGNCHSVWGFDAPPEAVDLPKHEVAIGAICKNENDYLDEWIRHHVSIGVTHIYLLDNGSTIPLADTAPNQKWLADITYIETDEGWLYLAAVLDCFSRRIVGWAAENHMRSELVEVALKNALHSRRPDPAGGLIHHSDRGVQYASGSFQKLLSEHRIVASMSRKGNCYDNAMMESFFGTLKTELDEPMASHAAARLALFEYIEVFYNRQRLHAALGYKSPATCEQQHQVA